MIQESETLKKELTGNPDDIKQKEINLRRMAIYFATAGSSADLRHLSIRYLYMDETDDYPPETGDQGTPHDLSHARTAPSGGRRPRAREVRRRRCRGLPRDVRRRGPVRGRVGGPRGEDDDEALCSHLDLDAREAVLAERHCGDPFLVLVDWGSRSPPIASWIVASARSSWTTMPEAPLTFDNSTYNGSAALEVIPTS